MCNITGTLSKNLYSSIAYCFNMNITTLNMIISSIFGLIGGAIASLIAPWVHWGIEKKRIQINRKKELIDNCKMEINKKNFDGKEFRESPYYANIRPFLSKELTHLIEKGDNEFHVQISGGRGGGVNNFKSKILDEINNLERKWKLI